MTHEYVRHATDWLMVGELVGSVLLIVLFLMAYCVWWGGMTDVQNEKQ